MNQKAVIRNVKLSFSDWSTIEDVLADAAEAEHVSDDFKQWTLATKQTIENQVPINDKPSR